METLSMEVWDADEVYLNNHNLSRLIPEIPSCPNLVKLFLQENRCLTMIPPSLFEHMPALRVLDLSRTSIQSLPQSISKLSVLEEFILQECSLLIELPPEVGALKNLKLFDLEGTEIMYLPGAVAKLGHLECLRVSLCAYADDYKERNGIENIIPRMTISQLINLKELSISVDPDAEWWEAELLEAILEELHLLPYLKTLKLYLPTAKEVQYFLQIESCRVPIYSSLWNFRLIIGHDKQLASCVPSDVVKNFEKLEKCLEYINGEGSRDDIAELIRNTRALFMCRHWTIETLSIFDTSRLKYCLLTECNEMHTIINEDTNINCKNGKNDAFRSLQYLAIHFMKKLQTIWRGPMAGNSMFCLKTLALHTCPELTTIFTEYMLDSLQNLTELIVEDCLKVNSLVSLESTSWRNGRFLRNLRKVVLVDLPELVSISSGVCIAPGLDRLLIFNCLKLDYLSVMELPRDMKAIKGEIEWWDALKYGQLTWCSAFVPLQRDGDLMDLLEKETNSFTHFQELHEISPHPDEAKKPLDSTREMQAPETEAAQTIFNIFHRVGEINSETINCEKQGFSSSGVTTETCSGLTEASQQGSSLQIGSSLSDHHLSESDHLYTELTKEAQLYKQLNINLNIPPASDEALLQYAEMGISRSESLHPLSGRPEDSHDDFKNIKHKNASRRKKKNSSISMWKVYEKVSPGLGEPHDDGYKWRKYGEKELLNEKYPRQYYRCSNSRAYNCIARKHIQRSSDDPSALEITYTGNHTCEDISPRHSSTKLDSPSKTLRATESSTLAESASTITRPSFEISNFR